MESGLVLLLPVSVSLDLRFESVNPAVGSNL